MTVQQTRAEWPPAFAAYMERLEQERFGGAGMSRAQYVRLLRAEAARRD